MCSHSLLHVFVCVCVYMCVCVCMTYQSLPMLGLHCLGNLSHLDGGSGRAAEMKTPPPLPEADCPGRQLGGAQECPAMRHPVNKVTSLLVLSGGVEGG